MERQEVKKFPLLHRLGRDDLLTVVNNLKFTEHAKQRIDERYDRETLGSIHNAIMNSPLAYVETDGTISIGLKDNSTFKLVPPKKKHHTKYLVITFYEPSLNNHDIWHKYRLALRGHNRG